MIAPLPTRRRRAARRHRLLLTAGIAVGVIVLSGFALAADPVYRAPVSLLVCADMATANAFLPIWAVTPNARPDARLRCWHAVDGQRIEKIGRLSTLTQLRLFATNGESVPVWVLNDQADHLQETKP